MNVRGYISSIVVIVTLVALPFASGCLTSESHWADKNSSNSSTNNQNTNNATTSNNQSTANNGMNNNNIEMDAGVEPDMGEQTDCFANRFDETRSLFDEARCVADEDGFTCTCFDGTTQSSSEGMCDANLIDLCGATADELGRCAVDANVCEATNEGFSCACAALAPVSSSAETCAAAMWESCYAGESCGDETTGCEAGEALTYQCTCDGLSDRPVDALRCEDALQVCSVGATFDGCTAESGSCDRTDDGYLCFCAGGSEEGVLDTEVDSATCEEVLARNCPS